MSSGQWLNFGMSSGTTGLTNLVGGPTSGLRTAYATKMARDPTAKRFYFVGSDHADYDTFLQYDEATNAWTVLTPVVPFGAATNHGYEHNIWVGGSINKYHTRRYGDTVLQRWNGGAGNNWTSINDPAAVGGGYPSAASGVCWFPDRGPNGSIIVFEQYDGVSGNGIVAGIDPVTLTSTTYAQGATLAGSGIYHNFAHYSPVHQLVWFGGGNGVSTNWAMTAAGTVSAVAPIPGALATVGPAEPGSMPFYNPANGNFIVIASPTVWYDFNPTGGGTWSVRPGLPGAWDSNINSGAKPMWGTIACPLPAPYNVVVFAKGYSVAQPAEMWLYKP